MKLSEYKNAIQLRLDILKASIVYTFQQETAYWANNWANILSTLFYTISMMVFIKVMYSNVDLVAGYTYQEMLLFLFIGQIGFYSSSWLYYSILPDLITDVNRGNLDLLLIKPVPSLFYVTFRKIKIFTIIRDSLPPMIALGFYINWQSLNLSLINFITGLTIIFIGIACTHVFHFLFTIPVFWLGESTNLLDMSGHIEYNVGKIIPFEGFGSKFQTIFSTLIPVLISTGIATSVILGKSSATFMFSLSLIVAIFSIIIMNLTWKLALRSYTSASS